MAVLIPRIIRIPPYLPRAVVADAWRPSCFFLIRHVRTMTMPGVSACRADQCWSLFLARAMAARRTEVRGHMKTRSRTTFLLRVVRTGFVVLASVLVAQSAWAQSTIFNIPSTDVVAKGKGYFEIDFLPQAPGPDVGSSIQIYNPRFIAGLPHDVEIGFNIPIYHVGSGDPSNLAYFQPDLKWRFYNS